MKNRVESTDRADMGTDRTLTPEDILSDISASSWIKDALQAALLRDPVDAANDAEVLARVLDTRCRLILFPAYVKTE